MILVALMPHVCRRLKGDIDEGIANGTISNPVTAGQGKALPYLQAVIFETTFSSPGLRPSSQSCASRRCLAGHFVPGGTKIAFNSWMGMRQTDVFGADVDVFRPELWTEASAEDLRKMQRRVDQIFGRGRYRCAGRITALIELNKTVVEVIYNASYETTAGLPGLIWVCIAFPRLRFSASEPIEAVGGGTVQHVRRERHVDASVGKANVSLGK